MGFGGWLRRREAQIVPREIFRPSHPQLGPLKLTVQYPCIPIRSDSRNDLNTSLLGRYSTYRYRVVWANRLQNPRRQGGSKMVDPDMDARSELTRKGYQFLET